MISIILPTYTPSKYIFKCLDSILNQTIGNEKFELIIILNGPKEPYYTDINSFIEPYMGKYNIFLYYTNELGVSNARNIGIELAKGSYITFVDDDDYLSLNYLKSLLEVSSETVVGLSKTLGFNDLDGSSRSFFLDKYYSKRAKAEYTFNNFRGYFAVPFAKLIHKNIIGNNRFDTKITHGEDCLFVTSLCLNFNKFEFADEDSVYHYRFRQGSATRSYISSWKVIKMSSRLIFKYLIITLRNKRLKNYIFYLSRIPATIFKNLLVVKKKNAI